MECHAIPATAEGNQAERHATQEVGQDQPLLLGLNTIAEILNSGFGGMTDNLKDFQSLLWAADSKP